MSSLLKILKKYIRKYIVTENDFNALGVKLQIIATKLNEPVKVVFNKEEMDSERENVVYSNIASISEAIACSASLPPVFAPYGIGEKNKKVYYFDGEIRDTLSTHVASEQGSDLVIASYSMQPYKYHKEMGSLHNYGIPLISNQAIYQIIQQKIETYIKHKHQIKTLVEDLDKLLKKMDISSKQKNEIIDLVLEKTQHKRNVDYIYIHPSQDDYKMFFYDHFSFNEHILNEVVKIGFHAAMNCLRPYLNSP